MYKFTVAKLSTILVMLSANLIFTAHADDNYPTSMQTTITSPAKRIVVMDFGSLDTLDKLQQSKRVIALPKGNTPTYLNQYRTENYGNTGSMKEPDLNVIAELKPDLIIIGGRQAKSFDRLNAIAPTMKWEMDNDDYLTYFTKNIRQLAALVGEKEAAETALNDINKKITTLYDKTSKTTITATVLMHNAGKLFPVNQSSFAVLIHDILGVKRADNTPKQQPVTPNNETSHSQIKAVTPPKTRPESDIGDYLIKYNPDIIFVIDRSAAIKQGPLDHALLETDKIKTTKAYKNKKIVMLTPDLWYLSGAGLESLSMQIDEVSAALK